MIIVNLYFMFYLIFSLPVFDLSHPFNYLHSLPPCFSLYFIRYTLQTQNPRTKSPSNTSPTQICPPNTKSPHKLNIKYFTYIDP